MVSVAPIRTTAPSACHAVVDPTPRHDACRATRHLKPHHRNAAGLFLAERLPRPDMPRRGRFVRLRIPGQRGRKPAFGGGKRQPGGGAEDLLVRGAGGRPAHGGGVQLVLLLPVLRGACACVRALLRLLWSLSRSRGGGARFALLLFGIRVGGLFEVFVRPAPPRPPIHPSGVATCLLCFPIFPSHRRASLTPFANPVI